MMFGIFNRSYSNEVSLYLANDVCTCHFYTSIYPWFTVFFFFHLSSFILVFIIYAHTILFFSWFMTKTNWCLFLFVQIILLSFTSFIFFILVRLYVCTEMQNHFYWLPHQWWSDSALDGRCQAHFPVALVDRAIQSFPCFSPKLA